MQNNRTIATSSFALLFFQMFAFFSSMALVDSRGVSASPVNWNCREDGGNAECVSPDTGPYQCQADDISTGNGGCKTDFRCATEAIAWTYADAYFLKRVWCSVERPALLKTYLFTTDGMTSGLEHDYSLHATDSEPTCTNTFDNAQIGENIGDCVRTVACPTGYWPTSDNTGCYRPKPEPCTTGLAVQCGSGDELTDETDYIGQGSLPLDFHRYYYSPGQYTPKGVERPRTGLGATWHHTYERFILVQPATTLGQLTIAYALRPNGDYRHFTQSGSSWLPRTDAPQRLVALVDGGGHQNGWQYTTENDDVEIYNYDSTTGFGMLQSITNKTGQTIQLTYSTTSTPPAIAPAPGLLIAATDSYGRSLQFRYSSTSASDPTLKLSEMIDPSGNLYQYAYDATSDLLTSVTFPGTATPRTYLYNESGDVYVQAIAQLTGVLDENNQRFVTRTYDLYGRVSTEIIGGSANSMSVQYDGPRFLNPTSSSTVTDAQSNKITHKFAVVAGIIKDVGISRCTSSSCTKSISNSISYDSAGYLQSQQDFNGTLTNFVYDDSRGLETQRTEASGKTSQRTIGTTWNPTFHVPAQRSIANYAGVTETMTKWTYNTRGQTLSRCEIDPAVSGATAYVCGSSTNAPLGVRQWAYSYCEQAGITAGTCPLLGLLLTVDAPRTDVIDTTTYLYYQTTDTSGCATQGGTCHASGDLKSVTNALGQVTTYVSYDTRGHITRIKDANGTYADMTYHPRGWLLMRIVRANADGSASSNDATTTIVYDNVGNVKQTTQPDGDYLSYTYDAAHRLTDVQDNLTNHIHYTLDAAGNRTLEQTYDPSTTLKRALTRQYDQLNQLTAQLNAATTPVQSFTNPSEAPPTGITYTDGYDGNGNAIYSIDGTTNHVGAEQQYDPLNRLIKTLQDHAGMGATHNTTTQYAYDTRDNLRSVVDPDSLTTNYTYDGLNTLTGLASPDTGNTAYTYDAAGNRLTQTDARSALTNYAYDALNRLTTITYPTTSLNVTYNYDQSNATTGCSTSYPMGRLTTITDSSGSTTYCYDRRGNVLTKKQITSGITLTTGYTYTNGDRIATISYPSTAVVTYMRNSIGQIASIAYKPTPTGTSVTLVSSATYLPFGPLNVLTFGNGHTLTKTYDQDYAIDKVVSSVSSGLVVDATVDVLGNLTNASSTVGASPPTQQYQYDPLYRLTNVQDGSGNSLLAFTYEATGDRTSKTPQGSGTQTYSYAPSTHHLTSVAGVTRSVDANGNTTSLNGTTLTYDNRNRLTAAGTETYNYNGKGERVSKSSPTTLFVYAENGMLLGEYNSAGTMQFEYIPMDGLLVGTTKGGTLGYVETDQLGTPRQVFLPAGSPANDLTVWKWDYFTGTSAFGENTPSVQTVTINLRFPGQYFDAETGLNYNYLRDYDSVTGRYIESDAIGLRGGINTFSYASNAPLFMSDQLGLKACSNCCEQHTWNAGIGGGVQCCGGEKVICTNPNICTGQDEQGKSFAFPSDACRIVTDCARRHEQFHLDNDHVDCSSGDGNAKVKPPFNDGSGECAAYKTEIDCLNKSKCTSKFCELILQQTLQNKLTSKKGFCTSSHQPL